MTIAGGGARPRPPRISGIVSDLDGTLLGSNGSLSTSTRWLLRSLSDLGVPLIVATARTPRAVRKIAGHEILGRVVCANGAIVWDARDDTMLHETWFDAAELAAAVARLRRDLPAAGVALLSAHAMFLDETYAGLRRNRGEGAAVLSDLDGVSRAHRISMIAVRHARRSAEDLLAPTREAFAGVGVTSFAGPDVVDITPLATSKAGAAAREMIGVGCAPAATLAFGDMPNDLPLLAWAGWACAMANGHPTVLDAADEIVPSNDDDGVAQTVKRLLGFPSPIIG